MDKENLQWLLSQLLDMKYQLFQNFVDVTKLHYNQLVEEEARLKTGEKYERGKRYNRWGSNPGSIIRIGEEKVPVEAPRYYDKENERTEESEYYRQLHEVPMSSEEVTKSVIESFGLSQSSISRNFIEESKQRLEEFELNGETQAPRSEDHSFIVTELCDECKSCVEVCAVDAIEEK